jgi:arylformamidase
LSGLYDLEPLRYTYVNDTIAMDAATAVRNAPIHNPPLGNPALLACAGGREQAAFHEQQRLYVDAWRAWGHEARELADSDHDHFSIVLELADTASPLSKATAALVFA